MTKWFNFGVSLTDDSVRSEIENDLREYGLRVYGNREGQVKATENAREVEESAVLDLLESYSDSISSVIVVTANDNADTASGVAYTVEDGVITQSRTEHSGGTDSRYDWYGMREDGMSVDGGKYY